MESEKQFVEIKLLIQEARLHAFQTVNHQLIDLYWKIGKYIFEKIEKAEWGENIVKSLSEYLKKNEPDTKGFSAQNLWRMKQFYEAYYRDRKLSPLVRELSWTNNLIIFSKTNSTEERAVYIKQAITGRYSKRELERQIDAALFERVITSQEKLPPVIKKIHPEAHLHFKENYVLDFLALPKMYSEGEYWIKL